MLLLTTSEMKNITLATSERKNIKLQSKKHQFTRCVTIQLYNCSSSEKKKVSLVLKKNNY